MQKKGLSAKIAQIFTKRCKKSNTTDGATSIRGNIRSDSSFVRFLSLSANVSRSSAWVYGLVPSQHGRVVRNKHYNLVDFIESLSYLTLSILYLSIDLYHFIINLKMSSAPSNGVVPPKSRRFGWLRKIAPKMVSFPATVAFCPPLLTNHFVL